MQVLFHKERLIDLTVSVEKLRVELGDPAYLVRDRAADIFVVAAQPSKWPLGLGRARQITLGRIGGAAASRLHHALEKDARLKLRIVEVQPGHLRKDGMDCVAVSIWGRPEDILPPSPRLRIISPSRIHEGPVNRGEAVKLNTQEHHPGHKAENIADGFR